MKYVLLVNKKSGKVESRLPKRLYSANSAQRAYFTDGETERSYKFFNLARNSKKYKLRVVDASPKPKTMKSATSFGGFGLNLRGF